MLKHRHILSPLIKSQLPEHMVFDFDKFDGMDYSKFVLLIEHYYKWLEKLYNHGKGTALIFARTETIGFHKQIWEKADGIFFFKGRLKFYYIDGTMGDCANAPSCLVAYGQKDSLILSKCNLKGKYIKLKDCIKNR